MAAILAVLLTVIRVFIAAATISSGEEQTAEKELSFSRVSPTMGMPFLVSAAWKDVRAVK
jgi:hypothetical protein